MNIDEFERGKPTETYKQMKKLESKILDLQNQLDQVTKAFSSAISDIQHTISCMKTSFKKGE